VVEVEIGAVGARGDGLAEVGGRRLYVPFTVAGDRAEVRPLGPRGDGMAAEVVRLLAAGPERGEPFCPLFGDCGGCTLQHMEGSALAAWKRGLVATALARRGIAAPVAETRTVPACSRRRVALAAVRRTDGTLVLGFNARANRRVVDVAACPLLVPALDALLPPLRDLLTAVLPPGVGGDVTATATADGVDLLLELPRPPDPPARERLAAFAATRDLPRLSWRLAGGPAEPVTRRRPARVLFGGVAVEPPPGGFLQPSAEGEAILVGLARAGLADLAGGRVADLYAGCGTFSFPLAERFRVHAVEDDAAAVEALIRAAAAAGLAGRVTAERRDLDRRPLGPAELKPFAAAVFDPPRAGAGAQAEALAAAAGLGRVVAVSCNPATFARDARTLIDGGFALAEAVPVDQFPFSSHAEVVGIFRR
jgi:23S rRNA (uracil1939-C5)-methyltransferase